MMRVSVGRVDTGRQLERDLALVRLAVAGKLIAAERKRERREPRIRRIDEPVGSGRQRAGQAPGPEWIRRIGAKQDTAKLA